LNARWIGSICRGCRALGDTEVGGVVLETQGQGDDSLGGPGDGEAVLDASGGLEDRHQPQRSPRITVDSSQRLVHLTNLVGLFDLGDQDQLGFLGRDRLEVRQPHRQLVDSHHPLDAAEVHRAQGVADEQARGLFLVGVNRVFEVEDHRVGPVESGVDEVLGLVSGQVEPRATHPVPRRRIGLYGSPRRTAVARDLDARAPDRGLDPRRNHEGQGALVFDREPRVLDPQRGQHRGRLLADRVAVVRLDLGFERDLDAAAGGSRELDPEVRADTIATAAGASDSVLARGHGPSGESRDAR